MKKAVFSLFLFAFSSIVSAQQASEHSVLKPLAFDRFFWLSSPIKPLQAFVMEVQDDKKGIVHVIYFPETYGLRGGNTEFVDPETLNKNTLWKLKLRPPTDAEQAYCKADNFRRTHDGKVATINQVPVLRFRSTQFNGFIQFSDFERMPCMIVDSKFPFDKVSQTGNAEHRLTGKILKKTCGQ